VTTATGTKPPVFNLDNLDPATVPTAPLGAFDDADWHDVPEGRYLLPVHDWTKFGNDCGPDGVTPDLDFLGFRVFIRATPTVIKTGKRVGRTIGKDRFHVGQLVLARGVQERIIHVREKVDGPIVRTVRYTPMDRLKREVDSDRWTTEHDFIHDGDNSPSCRCCPDCIRSAIEWPQHRWKAVPDQANAYANEVAAALIHGIKNENDIHRRLYGQLTGSCGICGRFLSDPASKTIGIGPDCLGRLRKVAAALSAEEGPAE
jgi:hypothetical protein